MPLWLKASGGIGSILVLIALIITFIKQLIAFVGLITFALKILIVAVFIVIIAGVGFLIFKSFNDSRRKRN
ncbi:hypothetical protein BH24ACI3_BH24ACI3_12960 [soil metagenome]